MDSATIRFFIFPQFKKLSRNYPPKKKPNTAIAEKPSANSFRGSLLVGRILLVSLEFTGHQGTDVRVVNIAPTRWALNIPVLTSPACARLMPATIVETTATCSSHTLPNLHELITLYLGKRISRGLSTASLSII